ncbi:MAG: transglutaminase-like domain-containing protein [Acidaminobacteraceae bacterium]
MLRVYKTNFKSIASMLLIYPLTVVSFKLFIFPLEMRKTILIILLVTTCFKLITDNKYMPICLSISVYIYIRVLILIKTLAIDVYLNGYGYFIKEMMVTIKGLGDLGKVEIIEVTIQKTFLYTLCIIVVSILYILINSKFIAKYFSAFNLIGVLYFVFAWFSYIDVEMVLLIYIVGVMLFNVEYQKLGHVISILLIGVFLFNTVTSMIPYKYINENIEKLAPELLILRSDYEKRESFFNFETSIYYPKDLKLGGSVVIDSNRIIMTVITAEDVLYLRGRVKDTYTGLSWKSSKNDYEKFESSKRYGEKSFRSDNLKSAFIRYEDIRSLTIFSPIGALEYSLDDSKLRVDRDLSVYYKSGLFEGSVEEYRVIFTGVDTLVDDSISYLKLADSITDRTRTLALDITKDATSDLEKVIALKEYLVANYPYSLEIDGEGDYADFVDDFLFEERKGYCTYFSSALAILSRINGIMSRYVEGYIVSPDSYDGGKYLVTEDKAHAWTEVYIEGSGWIVVESTPIYDFDQGEIAAIKIEKQELVKNEVNTLVGDENDIAIDVKSENNIKYYKNSHIFILFMIVIVVFITIIGRRKYKNLKLSNSQKSLMYIYKIDYMLTDILKLKKNKTYTVYYKMTLYNEMIVEVFNSEEQFQGQKNAIIKDVREILYNNKNVSDYDLINLEKYLKYIKKTYSK